MNAALVVLFKEVRENLRDKRTLINALVTGPLIAPLMFVMIINVVIARELNQAEAPLELPVIGASNAPNLLEALRQQFLCNLPTRSTCQSGSPACGAWPPGPACGP
jgi:sodium transport system permease protein